MFRREDGTRAEPVAPLVVDVDIARRYQDAQMARLASRGLSTREIGLLTHFHQSTVSRRLRSMPPEARRHYERAGASALGL
jgi:IS30 family transposase